jgi:arylsulfatase A-like enzyme
MNLIVVIIDSLRKDHIGCFGNPWIRTPNFDRFSEQAIIFDDFRPNAVPTIPFRRGFMLGRPVFPYKDFKFTPGLTGVLGWQSLEPHEVTFQQVIQDSGYVTGLITDAPHYFAPGMNFHRGFDSWQFVRGQECDPYLSGISRKDPSPFMYEGLEGTHMKNLLEIHVRNTGDQLSEEDCFAPRVFRLAEKWLEQNVKYYENFFLLVDCFDPHEPWDQPRFYTDLYDPGYTGREIIFPQNGLDGHLSPEEKEHIRALYAGEVTIVDRWFGHFMEKFNLMGLDEDTAVLFLSDHGLLLGEFGMYKKLPSLLYREMLDIPLMLMMPQQQRQKKRVAGFIQECDLAPTILKLLGIEVPDSMTGLDFWPLATGEKGAIREYAYGGYHTHGYFWDGRYHYFRDLKNSSKAYLFDLQYDASMQKNILEINPEVAKKMDIKLLDAVDHWTPPEVMYKTAYERPYVPHRLRSETRR